MNESKARLLTLNDDRIPALATVLGPSAIELLDAAVEPSGGHVEAAKLSQVSWWPGRSLTAVFSARVVPGKSARATEERLVVAAGSAVPAGGLHLEDADGARVALWRLENDPSLPGLAIAMDPTKARALLDDLDVEAGTVTPQLRAYRPGRRAVVELQTRKRRVFVKAVPPDRIEKLQSVHEEMAPHLPVPRSHGWSPEHGLVVLQALPGVSLRNALLNKRLSLPEPSQIPQLLDRIPVPADGRIAPAQAESGAHAAVLLREIVPELRGSIDALVEAFAEDRPSAPVVPVHGDLHEAQMTVQGRTLTGLLDIDTAGLGERIDDWATLLGHLAVLRDAVAPGPARRVESYARRLMAFADQESGDPARLRLRIAGVIVGLATGSFRVQSPNWVEETHRRLRLAETWVENSREIAKMRHLSGSSQTSLIGA